MDRHLLPDEVDLLVDADAGIDTGFGVAPLRTHVRGCAACRAEVDAARDLAVALETAPHFAPSLGFADRVMAEVHVFEPWHVALADTVRRLVPESRPLRALGAAAALATGGLLTAIVVWLLGRADLLVLTTDVAAARARAALWDATRDAVTTLTGTSGAASGATFAVAVTALVLALALATTGLRAAATASRRAGEPAE